MHNKIHIFQHILREGNQLADYLVNRAIDLRNVTFIDFINIDKQAKSIINSDKLQSAYLRITSCKG